MKDEEDKERRNEVILCDAFVVFVFQSISK